jgi:membrane protease YdiL (CAAX protease family)
MLGVILISISGILLTGELVVIQNDIIPIPPEYLEILRALFTISDRMAIHQAAFIYAVSPAICEEFLFRGIILQGAIGKVSRPGAIVLSGALFGIFHLDPYRLIGTMVLGFIMGYIAIKACSLLASIIFHLTNNLLILLVMNLTPLHDIPWLNEEAHLPIGILVMAAITFFIGLKFVRTRRNGSNTQAKYETFRNISVDEP